MELPFYRYELDRANVDNRIDPLHAKELLGYLESVEVTEAIDYGEITIALVRPGMDTATSVEGDDKSVAETIESHIEGLGVAAKFSIYLDNEALEDFYGKGPKQVMLVKPPERESGFQNKWEEFKQSMLCGPVTVLLLHSPDGGAVAKWREQVGHRDVEASRDLKTIRGRFALGNYNNLVHGSDTPEAVRRELGIITRNIIRHTG